MAINNRHLKDALSRCFDEVKVTFPEHIYVIRRNLMIACTLAIFFILIEPSSDGFEVNIGVLKGNIKNPSVLYIIMIFVCTYYLCWFHFACKAAMIFAGSDDTHYKNEEELKYYFLRRLSELKAGEDIKKSLDKIKLGNINIECESLHAGDDDYIAYCKMKNTDIRSMYQDLSMVHETLVNDGFEYKDDDVFTRVEYKFTPSLDELYFYERHKDNVWRWNRYRCFETVLPILYAALAFLILCWLIISPYLDVIDDTISERINRVMALIGGLV